MGRTEVEQVPEESCTTSEEKVCDTVTRQVSEQQCENVTERKCEQAQECTQEKQCKTENVCKNEIEKQCTSSRRCEEEQRCTTETNLVPETTYEDQCSDKVTKVCDQVAQVASVPSVAIASYARAPTVSSVAGSPLSLAPSPPVSALTTSPLLSQLYRGKRDADADPQYFINAPSTIVKTTPVCKDVITKECQKVP